MNRFSLIIPWCGNQDRTSVSAFDDTLASVLRYRCDDCQVIVVHHGDYNDPYGLAQEVELISAADSNGGLIGQWNAGVSAANGKWVGFLRPGIQLDQGWAASISAAFADPETGSVSPAIVSQEKTNRLVTAGVRVGQGLIRKPVSVGKRFFGRAAKRIRPVGPSSWAGFYRRDLLMALGECDLQLDPQYLDTDLAMSLANLGFGCKFSADAIFQIDDAKKIQREFGEAHGRSAERASSRQCGLRASFKKPNWAATCAIEILLSPWRPSNLKHVWQRFSARRFQKTDQHHRELLSILAKQRGRWTSVADESPEAEALASYRRAA